MKILALTRYDRLGSSSRVRFFQYFPYLREQGVQVDNAPFFRDAYIRRLYAGKRQSVLRAAYAYWRRLNVFPKVRDYDLLWVEKETLPWLPAWNEITLPVPYVVDYDDAVFHRYRGKKIAEVMRYAETVVAGNDYIADYARGAGAKKVVVIPSVVDTARHKPGQPDGTRAFTIGWIGAPVTVNYLELVRDPLEQFVSQQPDSKLLLVGGEWGGGTAIPVETTAWTEDSEVADVQQMDVGIMPLPDEPFERGKCGYKLVQYMACGLPVIASPVGVNAQIVEHGVNGFLASTPEEWLTALQTLRSDPALRQKMGAAGRKKVVREYSLQAAAPKLLKVLKSAGKKS